MKIEADKNVQVKYHSFASLSSNKKYSQGRTIGFTVLFFKK